jgi:hypothetical protein
MSEMMQYLSDLVHAQLEYKKPGDIPEGIQIVELVNIAHRNHMDYLILGALLKSDLAEEIKSDIKPFVMQCTIKSLVQVSCLKELEKRFETEAIYYQVLKGSVLKKIYPAHEMREMSDIDVMIYDENLDRAKKVVEEIGFTLYESVKHHDIYMKAPFLIIELHHALYDKDVDKNQYEYFQKGKQLIEKEGNKFALQFGTEDFYVYLIAHMAKHFYETGCGIRNVIDVYLYRQFYEPTWDEAIIAAELAKCGLTIFESRIHTLAQVWLGGQTPDVFSQMLFDYMVDCGIYGKGEYGIWGQFAMLNKKDNINYQSYAKWWYYFPPKSYVERDYPWIKKFPFLLVVAWGIRAVHGLLSKDGREKRKMLLNIKNDDVRIMSEIYKGMQLQFKTD